MKTSLSIVYKRSILSYSWAKCVLFVCPESNVNLLCIMHGILLTETTELEFEKYQYGHEF